LVFVRRSVVFAALLGLTAGGLVPGIVPAKAGQDAETFRHPQRAPSRARYKEIQTALKKRGYDPGPIDGDWGSKTAAALRQFEKDHQLPADGKLDALVLITLGLGPKRTKPPEPDTPAR
jgi:peptidoglycan hydrolase-like protein with peptidoglycan-binding domain